MRKFILGLAIPFTCFSSFLMAGSALAGFSFSDGEIWESTSSGLNLLDNNPATREIVVVGSKLYQRHGDGRLWQYTGRPCSGRSCRGWRLIDNNPATVDIFRVGNKLYQKHKDGRIWEFTGAPCSGSSCRGWRLKN